MLESRPQSTRSAGEYQRLIRAFELVYRVDPGCPKAPVALSVAAELYKEMGRQFSDDRYYADSVRAYQFLIGQYPYGALARDALYAIGEIYQSDLEDPDNAQGTFESFLRKFPRSGTAWEARARLKEIDELLATRQRMRAAAGRVPVAAAGADLRRGPEVTDIRDWEGPEYTRVVIALGAQARFTSLRLSSPDRIVFDLPNARLSPGLAGKSFPLRSGFLRQIRVAQFTPSMTRVVLDVKRIDSYSVFSLPNPFRLVIDIHGRASTLAARAPSRTAGPQVGGVRSQLRSASSRAGSSGLGARALPPTSTSEINSPVSGVRGQAAAMPARPGLMRDRPSVVPGPRSPFDASARSTPREEGARAQPAATRPAIPTEAGTTTLTRALGLKISRVVIDPGHGGHDTGTIGPTGLLEKDVALDVGLRLRKLIMRRLGSQVIMTRSDDTFIPLEERTAIANQANADLFVSIHANASRDPSARGIETYYLNFTSDPEALAVAARENASSAESVHQLQSLIRKIALTEKIEESREFARVTQRSLYQSTEAAAGSEQNRGLKRAPFVVLIGANMPSILAEISFLTNPRDERLLRRAAYRQRIAEALYRGMAEYVSSLGGPRIAQNARSARLVRARNSAPPMRHRHAAPANAVPDPPPWH